MLRYLGVTSLDPKPDTGANPDDNKTYLAEGDLDDIAGIQTAALQDIAADGPAYLSNVDRAASLFAPVTIPVGAVPGFQILSNLTGPVWINGCACLVAGDAHANEIVGVTLTTGGASVASCILRRPWLGTASYAGAPNTQMTVFCNAVTLEAGIKNVLEPVEIPGRAPLLPCADRTEFDLRDRGGALSGTVQTGWPSHFLAETRYDPGQSGLANILRVTPAPQVALPITFKAKLNPPVVSVTDLGTSSTDPAKMVPIPGQWVESIFLPYCLQRLTGHALFKNDGAKAEIARQYTEARKKLASFKPQIARQGGCVAFRP